MRTVHKQNTNKFVSTWAITISAKSAPA